MTSRGFVIGLALVLALAATAAVAVYIQGLEENTETTGEMFQVIVTKEDIIAGERLDELLSEGAFVTESVPEENLVDGAITSLKDLEGKTTSSPIVAGEQVTEARLAGSGELPGGTLGIPKGHTAISVALPAPAVIGGDLTAGDRVSVYGHFGDSGGAKGDGSVGGVTAAIAPDVQVLKVQGAVPGSSSGSLAANTRFSDIEIAVTVALKPRDAEKVIYAQQQGTVYLALIPPGEKGAEQRPLTFNEVIGR